MSEQTANPGSTAPDAEGAGAVDASSEIEKLDESLSDMTSALLGDAGDDDIDFEGMFAEIEPAGRTTPAVADNAPPTADPSPPPEGGEASVSEQLDEIEAAVAAAIDDADAELDTPEAAPADQETAQPEAAEQDAPEPDAPEPEDTADSEGENPPTPTAAPEAETEAEAEPEAETATEPESEPETEAVDTAEPAASAAGTPTPPEGEAEAADGSGADPDDSMAAVAEDLEASGDVPEGVAEPSEPSPPEAAEAPPEPAAANPEAAAEEPDAVESAAEPVEPDVEPVVPEAEAVEAAVPPESSDAETAPGGKPDETAPENAEVAAVAEADHGDASDHSEDAAASAGAAPSPAEPTKAPGSRKLPAGVAAVLARVGPVVGRLAKPVFEQMGGHVAKGAEAVAGSFTGQPKLIRHSVAWIALWTLFNAGVVWAYLGLFRSGSPTPTEGSGTQITGASVAPESVIGAGAAGVPGMPTSPSGR